MSTDRMKLIELFCYEEIDKSISEYTEMINDLTQSIKERERLIQIEKDELETIRWLLNMLKNEKNK